MFASIFYETCYMYVVHCDAPIISRNSVPPPPCSKPKRPHISYSDYSPSIFLASY